MKKLINLIVNTYETLSVGFLICVAITVVLQVFFRYVARMVVPWTEELARYLCIWMVFMGVAVAVARETHIKVIFLLNRMPEKMRHFLVLLSYGVMFLFNVTIFLGSIQLVRINWGQEAVTFPVSIGVLYLAVAISSGGILIFLTFLTLNKTRSIFSGNTKKDPKK